MYYKIYFDDNPLFICDKVDPGMESLLQAPQTVFMDSFSAASVAMMLQEMEAAGNRSGIFLHHNLPELKKAVWESFTIVYAGGGLVTNGSKEILMIFRRGKWDLPKGKLEDHETIEACALREVEEETGLQHIQLQKQLATTYHTYHEDGKWILKESHWYTMQISGVQALVPQAEEQIAEARWVKQDQLAGLLQNTFPSIKEVLEAAQDGQGS